MQLELIGANLKQARQSLRLSQTTVGKEIGLPRQAVSALESGKREITVPELVKLANLYRLRVESLLKTESSRESIHLPNLERRRRTSGVDDPLDEQDRKEIRAFVEALKALPNTETSKTASPSGKRRPIQPLSEIAERVRLEANLRTPPVNVYKALSCLGIRVRMTSFRSISGAFIPGGENCPPGVLINSDQPLDRTRYSAAHELGHYVLAHAGRGDHEITSPLGRRFSPKEVEADSFAAEFLMPAVMILGELKKLPQMDQLEELVYRLSDKFLVSYQAMIYRLTHLGVISASQKEVLLKIRPSEIEAKLQLKRKPQKAFDPKSLEAICASSNISPEFLQDIDGVRQLQELAFEEYARLVPEAERTDTAGSVYEKVALWVADKHPMLVPT